MNDRRNESQIKYVNQGKRVISLDPGVRKFLVGYDPSGKTVFIGDKASLKLSSLLLKADEYHKNKEYIKKLSLNRYYNKKTIEIDYEI